MKAILVIGHGSRSEQARAEFDVVVNMMARKTDMPVTGAHMELHTPSIPEALEMMINERPDIKEIKAVPLFLFEGIHIREDIPEILDEMREKYPQVEFKFARPIGAEEMLADILLKRAGEI